MQKTGTAVAYLAPDLTFIENISFSVRRILRARAYVRAFFMAAAEGEGLDLTPALPCLCV